MQPQQATRVRQPPAAQNRQTAPSAQMQVDEPASPTASKSVKAQEETVEEKNPSEVPASAPPVSAMTLQKSTATQSIAGSSKPATSNEEAVVVDTASSSMKDDVNPPGPDAVMEESVRLTRGRLRRARVTSIR